MSKLKFLALVVGVALLLSLPAAALAQGAPPPHVFGGTVTLDGGPAADGTAVTAVIDGDVVAETTVSGGEYTLRIQPAEGVNYDGKAVTFTVGAYTAAETGVFASRTVDFEKNLTILTESPALDSRAPAEVFASLVSAGTLEAFWGYDNDDDTWRIYIPSNTAAQNTRLQAADLLLTEVNVGDAGWMNLNAEGSFQGRTLSAGWSLISIIN